MNAAAELRKLYAYGGIHAQMRTRGLMRTQVRTRGADALARPSCAQRGRGERGHETSPMAREGEIRGQRMAPQHAP